MKEDDFKSGDRRDGGRPASGRRDDARPSSANAPRRNDQPGGDSPRSYGTDRRTDNRNTNRPRRDDGVPSRPFGRDTNSTDRNNDRPRPSFDREGNADRRSDARHSNDRPRPTYDRGNSKDDRRSDDRRDTGRWDAGRPDGDRQRPSFDRERNAGNSAPRPTRPGATRFGNTPPTERREEYPKPKVDRNSNARWNDKSDTNRSRFNDSRNAGPPDRESPEPRFGRDTDAPDRGAPDRSSRDDNRRETNTPWVRSVDRDRRDEPRAAQSRDSLNERSRDERPGATEEPRQRSGENRFGQERRYAERPAPNRPSDDREHTPRDGGDSRPYSRDERSERGRDSASSRPIRSYDSNQSDKRESRRDDDRPRSADRSAPRRDDGRSGPSSDERRVGRFERGPNYDANAMRNSIPQRKRDELDRAEKHDNRNTEPGTIRLNRYIANAGICSRREADALIAQGTVQVNGKVVTEMGHKVQQGDVVKYGNRILNPEKMVYVLLNKPKDYITTTDDPEERRTVMELVADAGPFRIYPVGRLDRNTTGLMLMTNDGELAEKLTHPSNEIKKVYQVELDKPITDEHFEAIMKGIELEDGPIKPDALSIVTPDAQVVGIEIHSGRNRIVRRIFENFGYEVTKLDRTSYAGLTKKELPRGKWRFLEPKEVVKLKYLQ